MTAASSSSQSLCWLSRRRRISSSGPQIDDSRPLKTKGTPDAARASIIAAASSRISSSVMSGRDPVPWSTISWMTWLR